MLQEHIRAAGPPPDGQVLCCRVGNRKDSRDSRNNVRPDRAAFSGGNVKTRVGKGVVCAVVRCPDLKLLYGVTAVGDLQCKRHKILPRLLKPNFATVADLNALLDDRLAVVLHDDHNLPVK